MKIEIVNWDKYNPRNDVKHPTWFRFQNNFWMDPAIYPLSPEGKLVWVILLAFASQVNMPSYDLVMPLLCSLVACDENTVMAVLKHLQRAGKIKIPTSRGRYVRRTDGGRIFHATDGTLQDEQISPPSEAPISPVKMSHWLVEKWNENCGTLRKVSALNSTRRAKIKARIAEKPDEGYWVTAIKKMAASEFCCAGSWATFDWLIKNDANHAKVTEGNYDRSSAIKPKTARSSAWDIPSQDSFDPNAPAIIPVTDIDRWRKT